MKGLILGGGTGSRLQPLTHTRPKHLIPIANKPVICYIIGALQQVGIDDIGIIVGNRGDLIREKLETDYIPGARFTYIRQDNPLGLAHAVKTAQPFLGSSAFIMVLGDNLFTESLEKAVQLFWAERADALISLIPVDEPQRFGVAEVEDGRIVSLVEKPDNPRSNLAIMGIYIFKETIFPAIEQTFPSRRGELEITDAIQQLIRMGGKVVPFMFSGWWMDIGRPEDVLSANRILLRYLCAQDAEGSPGKNISTSCCLVSPSAQITGSVLQGPLIIGEDCRVINSYIGPCTSIGNGSTVEDCVLKSSVLLENVFIKGVKGIIRESIIGEGSTINGEEGQLRAGLKKSIFLLGAGSSIHFDSG